MVEGNELNAPAVTSVEGGGQRVCQRVAGDESDWAGERTSHLVRMDDLERTDSLKIFGFPELGNRHRVHVQPTSCEMKQTTGQPWFEPRQSAHGTDPRGPCG